MLQIIWLVLADTMWPGRAKFWPWWYQIKKNVLTRAVSFNSPKQFCEVCIVAEPSRKDKMMIVRSNRWHKFSSALQLTIRNSSPRALWQEVDGIKDFLLGGCLDLGFVEPEVDDRVHYVWSWPWLWPRSWPWPWLWSLIITAIIRWHKRLLPPHFEKRRYKTFLVQCFNESAVNVVWQSGSFFLFVIWDVSVPYSDNNGKTDQNFQRTACSSL